MLQIFARQAIAQIILKPFTVRVQTGIARQPWARLWYLTRAFDPTGRGLVNLPADTICQLLAVSRPTLYEWLREGKRVGAFRQYKFKNNCLRIILGSLIKVCASLGLPSWGAVATVPLLEVNHQLRAIATGIATADLQNKSHFTARRSLTNRERQFFSPPTADQILAEAKRSSEKPARGQVPFLLWVGDHVAWVSKAFVPFGASQRSIGAELGINERTVRRHQQQLGLERRQIAQAKHAYQSIAIGLEHESDRWVAEPNLHWQRVGDDEVHLYEPNGISSSRREEGHRIKRQRLFTRWGKTWLLRCNIYGVSHIHLNSMQVARLRLRRYLDRLDTRDLSTAAVGEKGGVKKGGLPPGEERQNP